MPIIESTFTPPRGFSNCHVQTLLPRLISGRRKIQGEWQQFPTPDQDFVELFWHQPHTDTAPLVVIFHGLEGSVDSPYAWQLITAAAAQGWNTLVVHFRGCGPSANKLPRAYHSGDTADALLVLQHLAAAQPQRKLATVGFSLGGNMLTKLLGETAQPPITAAVAVAAPIDLAACAGRIDQGFSKVYRNHLLGSLKQKMRTKQQLGIIPPEHQLAGVDISGMKNFYRFDDQVTAPLHGFTGVDDYYQRASARPWLGQITTPLLLLHAADDPFMTRAVIPAATELAPNTTYELSQYGGHMGFVGWRNGRFWHWLPERIVSYLQPFLTPQSKATSTC